MIEKIQQLLQRYPLLPAMLSTGWNFAYAVFNGSLGVIHRSYWFITLCAFYAVLGFMRLSVVTLGRNKRRTELSVMRHNGMAMCGLSIVLVGIMLLTIREHHNPIRNKTVMIVIAVYTFIFVGWTIRNTIKAHKDRSVQMITLRNISCASAIASMLSLERGMLGTFGDQNERFVRIVESSSGAVAFILLIGLGIGMILFANKQEKRSGQSE